MFTIDETLDTIMQMNISSREMLLEILQKRMIEERRQEIAMNGKQAKADYKSGKILPSEAAGTIQALNKSNY